MTNEDEVKAELKEFYWRNNFTELSGNDFADRVYDKIKPFLKVNVPQGPAEVKTVNIGGVTYILEEIKK